jgi:hypothetical protein
VAVAVSVGVVVGVSVAVSVAVIVGVTVVVVVGVTVSVSVGVAVIVDVGVSVDNAAQTGPLMALESSVTAPVCARARPFKSAPVFRVMETDARMFPMNEVFVPIVAELPTFHHTLQGSPPVTDEPDDVVRVVAVSKIQTPDPTRFRFPVSEKLLVEQ